MEIDFKPGLVMQPSSVNGNDSGKRGVVGRFVITDVDGEDLVVEITDPVDNLAVEALMPGVKNGDNDALRQLAPIIRKYNQFASALLLLRTGDYGDAWLVAGDYWEEESMEEDAFQAFKVSAECGHPCGKCKLGRYYAEGKGYKKNKILAKKWLKEAAQECSDAEKYLDQYGLR